MQLLAWVLSSEGVVAVTLGSVALLAVWFRFVAAEDVSATRPPPIGSAADAYSANPAVRRRHRAVREGRSEPTPYAPPAAGAVDMPRVTERVTTPFGKVSVTVVGAADTRLTVLAYGDVGCNHRVCFNPWIEYVKSHKPFHDCRVVCIDPPGHHDDAKPMAPASYPSLDQMAQQVDAVVKDLRLNAFVCLGVGAGVNVLLRYCVQFAVMQYKVLGFMWVSGNRAAPSWGERLSGVALRWALRGGWPSAARRVASAALSGSSVPRDGPLVTSAVQAVPAVNVLGFLTAYLARPALTDADLRLLKEHRIPFICFAGSQAGSVVPFVPLPHPVRCALDMLPALDPSCRGWHRVSGAATLATLEDPAQLLYPMQLFLSALGFHHES